jgi:hypothetical protein
MPSQNYVQDFNVPSGQIFSHYSDSATSIIGGRGDYGSFLTSTRMSALKAASIQRVCTGNQAHSAFRRLGPKLQPAGYCYY